jgi:uncharacterized protein with PhoU and TrkA domain
MVLRGIGIHPIVREVFQRTEEHLARARVSEDSIFAGRTVDDLELAAEVGVDIIAIRRGKHWMINPEKEMVMPDDILLARGTESGLVKVQRAARGEAKDLE